MSIQLLGGAIWRLFGKIMAKRNKEKIIRNVTRVLPGNGPQISLMMASVFPLCHDGNDYYSYFYPYPDFITDSTTLARCPDSRVK
jgi:hypothetical protein